MESLEQVYDMRGKVALVTGAGSGIGESAAEVLAQAGATVICADIDLRSCKKTAEGIAARLGDDMKVESVLLDVTSLAQVTDLVDWVVADHGQLDVLANIAGVMGNWTVAETTEEDLDRIMSVNFKGTFFGCKAAARHMSERGDGSVINISSSAVDVITARYAAYAASKCAVEQLTKNFAAEVSPSGVRVNAISPGFVHSNMTARHYRNPDGSIDEARRAEVVKATEQQYPLRRLAYPEDIANAVLFLASRASWQMTGQVLRVNGGLAMP